MNTKPIGIYLQGETYVYICIYINNMYYYYFYFDVDAKKNNIVFGGYRLKNKIKNGHI